MTDQKFGNELARALARPDVAALKAALQICHDGYIDKSVTQTDEWSEAFDLIHQSPRDDPDRGLALVLLAAAAFDEAGFLAYMAAGVLEELLRRSNRPSEEFFQRILDEARKTERFRWMLSGVYRTGMISDQAAAIKRVVGKLTCDDPLPPRPWA